MDIFPELADNGVWSCIVVVAANLRQWGHFCDICGPFSALMLGWYVLSETRYLRSLIEIHSCSV
jgi:hypothetical protein